MTNPIAMVEVGVAWTDHTWQIMQVWISSSTPEDKIAETAIAAATKADHSGSIAGAWLAHYTHEDFLFAQEDEHGSAYMTDEEYVKAKGARCPVLRCRSTDIECGETEMGGEFATQKISCYACESTWVDMYKFIGYDCLNDNSPDPEDTDDEN